MLSSSPPNLPHLVIGGGGLVGLAAALALKTRLEGKVSVSVYDPSLSAVREGDGRASAVAADAKDFLQAMGAWSKIQDRAQPILGMQITESQVSDSARLPFLTFKNLETSAPPFAFMVENEVLRSALHQACLAQGVVLVPEAIETVETDSFCATVTTSKGQETASLVIAADGRASLLRQRAGILWIEKSYPQCAIVTTLSHKRPHEGQAVQHFLETGPFACLPLTPGGQLGHRSSIVWTVPKTEAWQYRRSLREGSTSGLLLSAIEHRLGGLLGALSLDRPVHIHPLSLGIARRFVGARLALVGDAAHVIHPLAGQGLNLGLRDIRSLLDVVGEAIDRGLDPGSRLSLERYERARRFETLRMGFVTDRLNALFSTDASPLRFLRRVGLGLVERTPFVKRRLIQEASGMEASGVRVD